MMEMGNNVCVSGERGACDGALGWNVLHMPHTSSLPLLIEMNSFIHTMLSLIETTSLMCPLHDSVPPISAALWDVITTTRERSVHAGLYREYRKGSYHQQNTQKLFWHSSAMTSEQGADFTSHSSHISL